MSVWDKYRKAEELPSGSVWDKYRTQEDRGVVGEVGAWMAGSDVEENIPVLGQGFVLDQLDLSQPNKAKLAALVTATSEDAKLESGFKNVIPDAVSSKDKFGNIVITAPTKRDDAGKPLSWERFYPNPKGADIPTATQAAGAVTLAQPVSKLIGGTGYRATAATGALESGFLEAITSAITDESYRLSEAGIGGATAGAFKAAFDVAKTLGRKIGETLKLTGGKPSKAAMDEIRSELKQAGLDPDRIMESTYQKMFKDINRGVDPVESARYRTSQDLPQPIPMTRGDVSDNRQAQLEEDAIRKGQYGEESRVSMENIRQEQSRAVDENLQAIQSGMGATGPIEPRAGGQAAQESLVAQRKEAQESYKSAYEKAQSGNAYIDPEIGDQIGANIYNSVRTSGFTETGAPQAFKILREEVEPLLREGQSINEIFAARSALSAHSKNLGTEGGAAGAMAKVLDQELIKLADEAMLYGDPKVVGNWLDAIGKFKEFQNKWNNEGILKKLTTTGTRDGETVLNVAPEDAANVIFGVALNPNKTNLARDLITMKKNLPSDVFDQLRQEFFIKLVNRMNTGGGDIKGSAFAKSWAETKKNKTLVDTMFTKEEQAQIDAVATTALRIGSRAQNYSNTAATLGNMITNLMSKLRGSSAGAAISALPMAGPLYNIARGQALVGRKPLVPTPSNAGVIAGAAGGATMGGETLDYAEDVYRDIRKKYFGE